MEANETERRKDFVMIAAAGDDHPIMDNLLERYVTTPQQKEREELEKIIKTNILEIKKELPGVAEGYNNTFNELKAYVSHRD